MELQSLGKLSPEEKTQLLQLLPEEGYDARGGLVYKNGQVHRDPYTNKPVSLANMAILPGSWIVIDYNPASIIAYQIQHPDA